MTPGSIVRVTPEPTVTGQLSTYGLLATLQVVLVAIGPQTDVDALAVPAVSGATSQNSAQLATSSSTKISRLLLPGATQVGTANWPPTLSVPTYRPLTRHLPVRDDCVTILLRAGHSRGAGLRGDSGPAR